MVRHYILKMHCDFLRQKPFQSLIGPNLGFFGLEKLSSQIFKTFFHHETIKNHFSHNERILHSFLSIFENWTF
jgi:hypothetical protein